jgi:hypothetical protein
MLSNRSPLAILKYALIVDGTHNFRIDLVDHEFPALSPVRELTIEFPKQAQSLDGTHSRLFT